MASAPAAVSYETLAKAPDTYFKAVDAMDIAAHNDVRVTGMITDQRPGTISLIQTDRIIAGGLPGGKK